jgi:cell division protein FtsL
MLVNTDSAIAFAILPFVIMFFLYLVFVAIGFTVLYFIVRAALNHSKLNQNVEMLRLEISKMNEQISKNSSHINHPKE